MWIAWIIFTVAAVAAIIIGIAFLFNVWRLTKMPLRHCSFSFIDRDAMPEEENSKLAGAEAFLLSEGFVYSCSAHIPQTQMALPGLDEEIYLNVYHHAESDVYAITSYAAAAACYVIAYLSCFSDGTRWLTYNKMRHYTMEFDAPHIFDDYLPDDAAAWRAHWKRISDSNRQPARDKDLAMQIFRETETGVIDRMLKRGSLKPTTEGRWRLTWLFAFRYALAVAVGLYKAGFPSPAPASTPEERGKRDAEAFLRRKEISQGLSPGKKHRRKLFVVTAILFLLVFGWRFDWIFSCVILFVVLLHELGHLLAMRAFGYKNTSILFLPGLGGLAMGEKKDASPFQRLIIYLAGPMPGILLSGILMYVIASTPPWHTSTYLFYGRLIAIATIVINYMNLLPVFPLDGGRVVEMLAFSRLPRGRFVFTLAGCLAILLAAFFMRETMLIVLGLLLAIGVPDQWRLAKVRLTMGKRDREAQTEEEAVKMTFEALSHPRFAEWSLNKRIELADVLVTERMERQPDGREILLGGIVYLLCLALPLLFAFDMLKGLFSR